ncbi:hypothetical protein [Jatrophihabitans sp.]|jgi:hypothetical protein|uniref:hypothetical protein n=1 Tax=Jatrophihabitans sp. TaxID=1932789 RepID=UPI002F16A363
MPTPEDVIAAWADITPWVQSTLPGLAQQQSLPNESQDAGDIGACNGLNMPGSTAIWGSDGDATITLTSLKIASMAGVQSQTATSVDGTTMHLPLSFSQLEIAGNYGYAQPCALYDMGKKTSTTTTNGSGTLTQTFNNSSLYYVATLADTVTLNSVVVNGSPTVAVHPDTGGMPAWMAAIGNFFSSFHEADALRTNVQNIFLTADFSQTMIGLLNNQIGS